MVKKSVKAKKAGLVNEKDIAMDFAIKLHEKFDRIVKASILFGSQAKNTANAKSDIDIVILIDDASINWDLELISWYREELGNILKKCSYQKEIHITTVKLTTWWQDLLYGDPVIVNILRYGEALIDIGGFFNPLKALLLQGRIHSTSEAVYAALQRAPAHIARSKAAEMSAVEGVYWAMIDSAQAALITAGKLPPSPEHIPLLLKTEFVDKGMLKPEHIKNLQEVYATHKAITYGQVGDIPGAQIDRWQKSAEAFIVAMTQIINDLIDSNKGQIK